MKQIITAIAISSIANAGCVEQKMEIATVQPQVKRLCKNIFDAVKCKNLKNDICQRDNQPIFCCTWDEEASVSSVTQKSELSLRSYEHSSVQFKGPQIFDLTIFTSKHFELAANPNIFAFAAEHGAAIIAEPRFSVETVMKDDMQRFRSGMPQKGTLYAYTGIAFKFIQKHGQEYQFDLFMMRNQQEVTLLELHLTKPTNANHAKELPKYKLLAIASSGNDRSFYFQQPDRLRFMGHRRLKKLLFDYSGIKNGDPDVRWKRALVYEMKHSSSKVFNEKTKKLQDGPVGFMVAMKLHEFSPTAKQSNRLAYGYLEYVTHTHVKNSHMFVAERFEYFKDEEKRDITCLVDKHGLSIFDKYATHDGSIFWHTSIASGLMASEFVHYIHDEGDQMLEINFQTGQQKLTTVQFHATEGYFTGFQTKPIPEKYDLKLVTLSDEDFLGKNMPKVENFKDHTVTTLNGVTHYRSTQYGSGDCVMRSVNTLLNGPFYMQKDMVAIAKKIYNKDDAELYRKSGGWLPKKNPYYDQEGLFVFKSIWKRKKRQTKGKKRASFKVPWLKISNFPYVVNGAGGFHDDVADISLKQKGAESYLLPMDRDHIPILYELDPNGLLGLRLTYDVYMWPFGVGGHSLAIVYDKETDEFLWMQSWWYKTPFRITRQKLTAIFERWAYGELNDGQTKINRETFQGFHGLSGGAEEKLNFEVFVVYVRDEALYEDEIKKLAATNKNKKGIIKSAVDYTDFIDGKSLKQEAKELSIDDNTLSFKPLHLKKSNEDWIEEEYIGLLEAPDKSGKLTILDENTKRQKLIAFRKLSEDKKLDEIWKLVQEVQVNNKPNIIEEEPQTAMVGDENQYKEDNYYDKQYVEYGNGRDTSLMMNDYGLRYTLICFLVIVVIVMFMLFVGILSCIVGAIFGYFLKTNQIEKQQETEQYNVV